MPLKLTIKTPNDRNKEKPMQISQRKPKKFASMQINDAT